MEKLYRMRVSALVLATALGGCGTTPAPVEEQRVAGETFVVTGASSGFGRGVALKLAKMGANVVLAARRTDVLEQVADEVRRSGGIPLVVTTDVAEPAEMERLAHQAVARFEKVAVWINNAGVTAIGAFEEIPVADHARLIDVNLKGVIYGSHAAMRLFRAQGHGTLVNVSSLIGEVPLAYQASYSASKAGVLALGRALNEELRLRGSEAVAVATVLPWAADTPIWSNAANYTGREPSMPAMDDPQKVVDAIVRLALNPRKELAVGWKAKTTSFAHGIFPGLTERIAANAAHKSFMEDGDFAPPTSGSLHEPIPARPRLVGESRPVSR